MPDKDTMDIREDFVEIIRDTREYLLSLKETGVEEVCAKKDSPPPLPPPAFSIKWGEGEGKGTEVTEQKARRLTALRDKIGDCRRCKLWTGRTHIVFGTGDPGARLLFVGEGPGEEEDRQGKPFVGKAGELLTKMIGAMGLTREDVYIANVVKCRPPGNRNPEADEIEACRPFLEEQIAVIDPRVICALGTFAAQTLLDTTSRISALRGKVHEKGGHKIVPTFHPAYLLRNPQDKRLAWEDLQIIMKELGLKQMSP